MGRDWAQPTVRVGTHPAISHLPPDLYKCGGKPFAFIDNALRRLTGNALWFTQGVSLHGPADRAILAPQFREADGAYSLAEKNALAKAIVREHRFPKADSGT